MSRRLSPVAYGHEKLMTATFSLAEGNDPLPQRLADAYLYGLTHIRDENLPSDELRAKFRTLAARLTSAADQGDGTVRASVAGMTWEEARDLAESVVSMFIAVHDWINEVE